MSKRLFSLFIVGLSLCGSIHAQTLIIPQVPGSVGDLADFSVSGIVTVGADGKADFLVDFDPLLISVPDPANPFVYSTTLSWLQPVDTSGVVVTELVRGMNGEVGNLAAFGIAPVVTATGASSGASFPGLPFNVVSYEVEVTGLQPGDVANFVKVGNGGRVIVPEPATFAATLLGMLSAIAVARRAT